ncbi:MAG TPA: RNA polymerase factor sigma-54, partial [Chthoniobacterales bacterium]
GSYSAEAQERRQFFFDSLTRPLSLREALSEQLALIDLLPMERALSTAILGNVDESGYLAARSEEIAAQQRVTPLQVEEVLEKLQERLEPAGIAARDLRECLLLQLRRAGREQTLDYRIVEGHLEQLARRKFQEIARELKVTAANVQQTLENISRLDPRPGHQFSAEPDQIIVADVFVRPSEGGGYEVFLNQQELPHLRISNTYKDMLGMPGADNREIREYIREKLRGGRFFLRSLEQRNQTILSIAKEIVQRQREFFDHGSSHLTPMTMGQVAEAVGVHETTVSRAVSGKYMESPQGLFELKYFFTAGYRTAEGQAVSNESVRQTIADLVAGENSCRPLSDQDMVDILEERGIPVARRTIAKYRDQLGILPSHLRKRG